MTWRGQIEVTHISEGYKLETLADMAKFTITALTLSDHERSNRGHAYFSNLKTLADTAKFTITDG